MNVIIRDAHLADLPTLLEFEQGVIDAERPMDADLKRDDINYYDIKELIQSPKTRLAVAEIDGQLVGCGYAKIQDAKPWHNFDEHAYLGFMYVYSSRSSRQGNKPKGHRQSKRMVQIY